MWWRPAKRIWCSECTGLGHTERRTEARTRYSDWGGGGGHQRGGSGAGGEGWKWKSEADGEEEEKKIKKAKHERGPQG